MRQLIFSLAAPLLLSAVAVAADDAAPPIASGAIPSGYVWYSGGSIADVGGAGINAEGEVYNLARPVGCDSACPPTVCTSRSSSHGPARKVKTARHSLLGLARRDTPAALFN
jgi:hypothetical protein